MDTGWLGGLTFVLVFAGMILVHEIGHFVAARLMKIEVEEFGIGIPPRMFTLFTWKGTRFSLNWIPLGGFNRIKGEDDPTVPGGMAAAKPWKKLVVLLAGVTMNLLTAVIAYSLLFNQVGIPQINKVEILALEPGAPAEQAGILPGDIVMVVEGERIQGTQQLVTLTRQYLGQPMQITLQRGGEEVLITVTPRTEWPADSGPMGVALGVPLTPAKSWFATLPLSFQSTATDMGTLFSLPARLIAGKASPQEAQLGGPRTIWNLFQAAVASDVQSRQPDSTSTAGPTHYTLMVIIGLSISLGTLNLLPIPALDGGRILFLIPELLFHRAIPAKFQATVNGIAFFLLLAFMIIFYVKDFIQPVAIPLP